MDSRAYHGSTDGRWPGNLTVDRSDPWPSSPFQVDTWLFAESGSPALGNQRCTVWIPARYPTPSVYVVGWETSPSCPDGYPLRYLSGISDGKILETDNIIWHKFKYKLSLMGTDPCTSCVPYRCSYHWPMSYIYNRFIFSCYFKTTLQHLENFLAWFKVN